VLNRVISLWTSLEVASSSHNSDGEFAPATRQDMPITAMPLEALLFSMSKRSSVVTISLC